MNQTDDQLVLYLQLARASEQRRKPMVRDKLLLLAAIRAIDLKLDPIAAYCRHKILANNPGHLVRHFEDIRIAMQDDRFQALRRRVERSFPREKAEYMHRSLGLETAHKDGSELNSYEYAASLLGITSKELDAWHYHGPGDDESSADDAPISAVVTSVRPRRWGKHRVLFGLCLLGAIALLAALIFWLSTR